MINQIIDTFGIVCMHQKDFCTNSTDICIQSSSYCVPNGTKHFLCLCKSGYYDYKYLRNGQFSTVKFFGIIIGVIVVLNGSFSIWHNDDMLKKIKV